MHTIQVWLIVCVMFIIKQHWEEVYFRKRASSPWYACSIKRGYSHCSVITQLYLRVTEFQ